MLKLVVCLLLLGSTQSARILAIIPTPSLSHHLTFRPLWKELSLRGHQVTVITPCPQKDPTLVNLTEIDVHDISYRIWNDHIGHIVKVGRTNYLRFYKYVMELHTVYMDQQLSHPEVKKLIQNGTEPFDLVIAEYWHAIMYSFGKKFRCPVIGIGSMDANCVVYGTVGSTTHPLLYRDFGAPYQGPVSDLGFFQRALNVGYEVFTKTFVHYYLPTITDPLIKKHFGIEESLPELARSASLILVNKSPIFQNVRPAVPAVVYFGGAAHINPPKPLTHVSNS